MLHISLPGGFMPFMSLFINNSAAKITFPAFCLGHATLFFDLVPTFSFTVTSNSPVPHECTLWRNGYSLKELEAFL